MRPDQCDFGLIGFACAYMSPCPFGSLFVVLIESAGRIYTTAHTYAVHCCRRFACLDCV